MPFNGSHGVKNALRTLPGVVMDGSGGIHVDGARESQTLFILDGFNVGDPLNGGFDPKVSVEAVQALTVRNGVYAAEFGKGSGGVIEVATHVGGDRLRYSATDFFPTIVREKGLRIQDWTPRLSVSGPLAPQAGLVLGQLHRRVRPVLRRGAARGPGLQHQPAPQQPAAAQVNLTPQERAARRRRRQHRRRPAPRPRPARSGVDDPRRAIAPMVRQRPRSARLRQRRGARSRLRRQPHGAAADAARPRRRSSARRPGGAATTTTTAARTRSATRSSPTSTRRRWPGWARTRSRPAPISIASPTARTPSAATSSSTTRTIS